MQHQDEVMQAPMALRESQPDFTQAVEKAVSERIKEVTAGQAQEIEQLKQGQQEMLELLKAHLKKD